MKKTSILLIALGLFFSLLPICGLAIEQDGPEGYEAVYDNGTYGLFVKEDGSFAVLEKSSGYTWYSNPINKDQDVVAKGIYKMDLQSQLLMRCVNKEDLTEKSVNTYTGSVKKGGFTYQVTQTGAKFLYTFPDLGIVIPMYISINSDHVSMTIPMKEVQENGKNKIVSLSPLPYFGACDEEEGYLVVPDGSGAVICFNNGKESYGEYRQTVYGSEQAVNSSIRKEPEFVARLPIFGMKRANHGFLAVIAEGEAQSSIVARVSGMKTGYNVVYPEFLLTQQSTYKISSDVEAKIYDTNEPGLEAVKVEYFLLKEKDCDYSGMARRYRRYLIENQRVRERNQSVAPALYVNLYGAVRKDSTFLGIPIKNMEVLTSYEQVAAIVTQLKEAGVDSLVLEYEGWLENDLKETTSKSAQRLGLLGSQQNWNDLLLFLRQENVCFFPKANLLTYSSSNSLFNNSNAAKTLEKTLVNVYTYKLSTNSIDTEIAPLHWLSPLRFHSFLFPFFHSFCQLNLNQIGLGQIGGTIYADPGRGISRQEALQTILEVAAEVDSQMDNVLVAEANSYILPYTQYISNMACSDSGFDMVDQAIPFYQISVNGLISYSTSPINFEANPTDLFLEALETGAMPKYSWIYTDAVLKNTKYCNLFGMNYAGWLEIAAQQYRIIREIRDVLGDAIIYCHETIDDGVTKTTYENGYSIFVNHGNRPVTVAEGEIAAKSYLLTRGGEDRAD